MIKLEQLWPHIAVAAGYALSYALLREVSFSHWFVLAGFQLSLLILMPYRYWAALAIGETWPVAYSAVLHWHQFGLMWAIVAMVPALPLIMPAAYLCRTRLRLFRGSTTNVNVLILCTFIATSTVSGYDMVLLCLAPHKSEWASSGTWLLRYLLGHYLGILTVTPLVLSVRESGATQSWRQFKAHLATNRLLFESIVLLPFLGGFVWIGANLTPESVVRHILQMAMFLPVLVLALRYGWQGAASGGTLASFAVVLLMPARYDHDTLLAEALIAFAMTSMLMLGRPITMLIRREQQERLDVRQTLVLAQRNYHEGERQLRRAAYVLDDMQRTIYRLLQRLMTLSPHEAAAHDSQTRSLTRKVQQLTEYAHPFGIRRGLPQALQGGSLVQTLADYGVAFEVRYGTQINTLPHALHLVLYRLICDGVTQLCTQRKLDALTVHIRSRIHRGESLVRLAIEGKAHHEGTPPRPWSKRFSWDELLSQLRTLSRNGDFKGIVENANTFEGRARQRVTGDRSLLVVVLREPHALTSLAGETQLIKESTY